MAADVAGLLVALSTWFDEELRSPETAGVFSSAAEAIGKATQ